MECPQLASAGDDVKLWDCSQGVLLLHQFNPHSHNVASISWNFDGSFLASCSINDETVMLTYTKNNALTTVDLQCGLGVQCVGFNSNSRYLLCGGSNGVSIWDLKTKSLKKSFKEAKGAITAARYNWNDSYIAAGSEAGEIILHNTITGHSSSPLLATKAQAIRQLEYSAFKKSMFGCTSDDGVVALWDANARRQLHVFQEAHVGPATGLAFSPINEMLMISVGLDKRMVCYDIQKKKMLKAIDTQSPLTCIDIMHDGATAAVGSTRGKIYFYDLRQGGGSPVYAFQAHKTSVQAVRFMPLLKLKNEDVEGSQNSIPVSSTRRQLPQSPHVMQSITPSRQVPDSVSSMHPQSLPQTLDIFSPAAEGGPSQRSLSATHLSLTSSRGEDSYAGVFSPLTNGRAEQASSQSFQGASSLLSTPSFLGQSSLKQASSSAGSPHTTHQLPQAPNGVLDATSNLFIKSHSNYTGFVAPGGSQGIVSQRTRSPQGAGASPSLPRAHKYSLDTAAAPEPQAATASSSQDHQAPLPVLHLSPAQDSGLVNGGEDSDVEPHGTSAKDYEDVHSLSPRSSQDTSPGQKGNTSQSALLKVVKADLKEYREQLRQEFSALLWGKNSQLPGHASSRTAVSAVSGTGVDVDVGSSIQTFQTEFLRNLVADAMEEVRDEIHRDIQRLHVEMLHQFHNFHMELQSYLTHYADTNRELMFRVKQLEEENRRLKKHF